jgi:hypothetical protein
MLFQSRSLATAVSLASQFLLWTNMLQHNAHRPVYRLWWHKISHSSLQWNVRYRHEEKGTPISGGRHVVVEHSTILLQYSKMICRLVAWLFYYDWWTSIDSKLLTGTFVETCGYNTMSMIHLGPKYGMFLYFSWHLYICPSLNISSSTNKNFQAITPAVKDYTNGFI